MVTLAPLVRRKIHDAFKGAGEMKLVGVAYLTGDFCNREICRSQVFAGLVDTVGDQELLRAFSRHFFEKLAEITAIESQMLSDILNGDIFHVVCLNIIGSGLDIEFFDIIGRHGPGSSGMLHQ